MTYSMLATPLLMLISSEELAARETEALLLAAVGMGVVFLALVTIGVCIHLLGLLFRERVAPVIKPVPSPVVPTGIDARTIAVISAAAYAAVGRPVRVQRITFINRNTISAWAERGRVSIHGSHNVRRTL